MFSFASKLFGNRSKSSHCTTQATPCGCVKPLTDMNAYQDLTVVRIKLPELEINRLSELGLRTGATIRVLQSSPDGALLVAVGDGRIGLNFHTAQKIYVY